MPQFYTGEELSNKLTDIIWNAKTELLILSPFIHLDEYCKKVFKNYKHTPELEVILVFGKNEREAGRSLNKTDLDFFKEFKNITIIYCKDLHAKFYSNEKEGLLTSLNLLDRSMESNIEYGIYFSNTLSPLDKLYADTVGYTNEVIKSNPCVYVKRPLYKKEFLGLKKSYITSDILWDVTDELYQNKRFSEKFYSDFEGEINISKESKPNKDNFQEQRAQIEKKYIKNDNSREYRQNRFRQEENGYCIRSGERIPFDPSRPFSYYSYLTWAQFENWDYPENYCHRTGRPSNGKTSMANPILK